MDRNDLLLLLARGDLSPARAERIEAALDGDEAAWAAENTEAVASALRDRFRWKKVEVPKPWNPKSPEELIGFYAGRTKKNGRYGQCEVVLVAVPSVGVRMVSGTQITQLIDAAMIDLGQPVRVVFNGTVKLQGVGNKKMKLFDLFVRDGDPIPKEDMPTMPTYREDAS